MSAWLPVAPERDGQAMTLVCLPWSGAGASAYWRWHGLEPALRICPVQLPGRERRLAEPPVVDLAVLVDALVEVVRRELAAPYALLGHSQGALTAFALVRRLEQQGGPVPVRLFLSGLPRHRPERASSSSPLHLAGDDELLAALLQNGAIAAEVLAHRELAGMIVSAARADLQMYETCLVPDAPPIQVPITAMAGTDDPVATPAAMIEWSGATVAGFKLRTYPGSHFFINEVAARVLHDVAADVGVADLSDR